MANNPAGTKLGAASGGKTLNEKIASFMGQVGEQFFTVGADFPRARGRLVAVPADNSTQKPWKPRTRMLPYGHG